MTSRGEPALSYESFMAPSRNVTQAEIARSLGIHQTTVSAILAGKRTHQFSPEMRERVEAAARRLGYRPSAPARALRGVGSRLIGVLHFGRDKDVESQRLTQIVKAIHHHGYQPLAMPMAAEVMQLSRQDEMTASTVMLDAHVEALVLSGFADDFDLGQLERFRKAGIPMVSVTGVGLPGIAFFGDDRRKAIYDLTTHLIAQGRRKLVYLHRWASEWVASDLFADVEGFRQAAREHGLQFEDAIAHTQPLRKHTGRDAHQAGENAFAEIWESGARPQAVLCYDDSWALGVYGYCQRHGIRIPEEVAIVGYENQRLGCHLHPRLTTASLPYEQMASAAMEYLAGTLQQQRQPADLPVHLYPCTLEIRESCGAGSSKQVKSGGGRRGRRS